jgi:hypothetical protein
MHLQHPELAIWSSGKRRRQRGSGDEDKEEQEKKNEEEVAPLLKSGAPHLAGENVHPQFLPKNRFCHPDCC